VCEGVGLAVADGLVLQSVRYFGDWSQFAGYAIGGDVRLVPGE
jgi:hypothetical protein